MIRRLKLYVAARLFDLSLVLVAASILVERRMNTLATRISMAGYRLLFTHGTDAEITATINEQLKPLGVTVEDFLDPKPSTLITDSMVAEFTRGLPRN